MAFAVDASVAAAWFMPGERDPRAEKALAMFGKSEAQASFLWWFEVRNILIVNDRRKRIDETHTGRALQLLSALPIELGLNPVEADVLALARKHELTVYDAAYLELAQRLSAQLATLDDKLVAAARTEGVVLIE